MRRNPKATVVLGSMGTIDRDALVRIGVPTCVQARPKSPNREAAFGVKENKRAGGTKMHFGASRPFAPTTEVNRRTI
jgi:hypothetical protein